MMGDNAQYNGTRNNVYYKITVFFFCSTEHTNTATIYSEETLTFRDGVLFFLLLQEIF